MGPCDVLYRSYFPKTMAWFSQIEFHAVLPSTNGAGRARVEQGCPSGTVICAFEQTRGRGRRGRTWWASDGSLSFSVLWSGDHILPAALPLVLGTAAADALHAYEPRVRVKWPNDLWVGQRKLAGMLGEGIQVQGQPWTVFGVGLNVNGPVPDPLCGHAVSLQETVGRRFDRRRLLREILQSMEETLDAYAAGERKLAEDMGRVGNFLGRWVEVRGQSEVFSGRAVGVKADGTLVVEGAAGRRLIRAGDVSLRPQ